MNLRRFIVQLCCNVACFALGLTMFHDARHPSYRSDAQRWQSVAEQWEAACDGYASGAKKMEAQLNEFIGARTNVFYVEANAHGMRVMAPSRLAALFHVGATVWTEEEWKASTNHILSGIQLMPYVTITKATNQ